MNLTLRWIFLMILSTRDGNLSIGMLLIVEAVWINLLDFQSTKVFHTIFNCFNLPGWCLESTHRLLEMGKCQDKEGRWNIFAQNCFVFLYAAWGRGGFRSFGFSESQSLWSASRPSISKLISFREEARHNQQIWVSRAFCWLKFALLIRWSMGDDWWWWGFLLVLS